MRLQMRSRHQRSSCHFTPLLNTPLFPLYIVEGRHLSFSSSRSLSVNYCVPLTMAAAAAGLLVLILPPSSTLSSSSSSSCSQSSTLPTTPLKAPSLSSYFDSIVSPAIPMSSSSSFSFLSPFFIIFVFLLAFSASFSISLFLLYRHLARHRPKSHPANNSSTELADGTRKGGEENPTHLLPSLLLDLLSSSSAKWVSLVPEDGSDKSGSGGDSTRVVKKKKRRVKKKGSDLKSEENGGEEKGSVEGGTDVPGLDSGNGRVRPELVCLYPFTSTGSAIQRRIKQQYDQLVKCNESKGLTLAQVGEFANCLIEARDELKNKSEVIKRKFTITKALLLKADRSSIDRIRQQICKLELEQKRLEEDAFVYNWLQQQLKLSPAYNKMLEISACKEMKAKSPQLLESEDTEFSDISFEELLAQEKKDVFWQKNGKSKLCAR